MNHDTYTAQKNTWARPSDLQIESYFRDPENFHAGMRIAAIIYAVGQFDLEVDWDRGTWIYEWRKTSIRIRVTTASAYVTSIELLDQKLEYGHANILEVLWEIPDQHH